VGFWSRPGLSAGLSGLTDPALIPDWSKGGGEGRRAFEEGMTRIRLENDYVQGLVASDCKRALETGKSLVQRIAQRRLFVRLSD
jgi:hypothetical protein